MFPGFCLADLLNITERIWLNLQRIWSPNKHRLFDTNSWLDSHHRCGRVGRFKRAEGRLDDRRGHRNRAVLEKSRFNMMNGKAPGVPGLRIL
jgi:hypothetical protein